MEAVAPWCSIDTRTGRLAVVLEEYNCFDAEMYADELPSQEGLEFRDDQRSTLPNFRSDNQSESNFQSSQPGEVDFEAYLLSSY